MVLRRALVQQCREEEDKIRGHTPVKRGPDAPPDEPKGKKGQCASSDIRCGPEAGTDEAKKQRRWMMTPVKEAPVEKARQPLKDKAAGSKKESSVKDEDAGAEAPHPPEDKT